MKGRGGVLARRPRADRGAGTVEYVGLVLITAMCLTVGFTATTGSLAPTVTHGVCRAQARAAELLGLTADECAPPERGDRASDHDAGSDTGLGLEIGTDPEPPGSDLPQCTTEQQDALRGVGGTAFFIHAESFRNGQLQTYLDPETGETSGQVIISSGLGLGLDGSLFRLGRLADASGRVVASGERGTVYSFDSAEDAEEYFDDFKDGNVLEDSIANAALSYSFASDLIDAGAVTSVFDLTGGGDEEEEEAGEEEVDDEYEDPDGDGPATGRIYRASLQAEGHIGFDVPKVDRLGVDVGARTSDSAAIQYNADGTSKILFRQEGSFSFGADLAAVRKAPLVEDLGISAAKGYTGAVQYEVVFDEDNEPTEFRMTLEGGDFGQGGGGATPAGVSLREGDLVQHTYTLDLTDPENLQALKDTVPTDLDSSVLDPRLLALPVLLPATDTPLSRALYDDAVKVEQVYDTSGGDVFGRTPSLGSGSGLGAGPFAVDYYDNVSERTLREARYVDLGEPDPSWQDLPQCVAGD